MNCFSRSLFLVCLLGCTACGAPASETTSGKAAATYFVHYTITPDPRNGSVGVEMLVRQTRGQLRELSFSLVNAAASEVRADSGLTIGANNVSWIPGKTGGSLHWQTRVSHQRNDKGYDAWLDEKWGIFRAEDIIPRGRTRTLKGARSETSLSFELPVGWVAVSEYSTLGSQIEVENPARRFDQPRGWMAMGNLGIRRETIAGTRIAIAAPEGQAARRMDMLALLNWILPELTLVLPDSIPRLTIISAGDPMWRGGLSAPSSIFIHAERPLISENATSTLAHEVVHVALGLSADSGFDWIVEGLAEYYSLELLQRGGAITPRRYKRALEKQAQWATEASKLCGEKSTGPITALAVITFRDLDKEIRNRTDGKYSLDDVVTELATSRSHVSLQSLNDAVATILAGSSDTLRADLLPGCEL